MLVLAIPAVPGHTAPAFSSTDTAWIYLPLVSRAETYPADNRAYELAVLQLVNRERAIAGLPALHEHPALTQAARRHAEDLLSHQMASHTGSDGSTAPERMLEAGYPGIPWTEAAGIGARTPEDIVIGWMHSPRHHDIVLDRTANMIGMGYAYDATRFYQQTWVIDLGKDP